MGKVVTQASMSLDGYIADPSDNVGPLFEWYGNGDVEFTGADPARVFQVSAASADYLRSAWADVKAGVIGRRLFDLTNGWNGRPPVGEAGFVVTHQPPTDWDFPDAPFTFVTDGVASAVAQAKAFAGDGERLRERGQRRRAGLPGGAGRRGPGRPGAGGVRCRRPLLRRLRGLAAAAGGPADRAGETGNAPVLPPAQDLTPLPLPSHHACSEAERRFGWWA
jgi:dihydrofolate reductase